jgi:hypothetical protein
VFLVCRQIYQDSRTGQHILVGPVIELFNHQFPWVVEVAAYVQLASGHGSYRPQLELQDAEGRAVWSDSFERPFEAHNPLATFAITFHMALPVPRPGRYELVLFANGQEVVRHALKVGFPGQPIA